MKNAFAYTLLAYSGWNIFYTATKHTVPTWLSVTAGIVWVACTMAATYMAIKPKKGKGNE